MQKTGVWKREWEKQMHELSVVKGIIGIIDDQKKKTPFTKLMGVEVICGPYNCLSEENIQFCFDASAELPYMKGAKITVKKISDNHFCLNCFSGYVDESLQDSACPSCRSFDVVRVAQNTVFVSRLEVD